MTEFIRRGNVMDMAIGIIMGSAFGAIVNSLVKDILMPIKAIRCPHCHLSWKDDKQMLKCRFNPLSSGI